MAAPAQAITFGDKDDGGHPNVGALMLALDIVVDGTKVPIVFVMCTGTLLEDDVFLTAAHCVSDPFPEGSLVGVSFEDDVTGIVKSDLIEVLDTKVHPSWQGRFGGSAKNVDIAVARLAESPAGVEPAILPDEGLVDGLDYATQRFTTVGYGVARDDKTKGRQSLEYDPVRRVSEQSALQANRSWLLLSMNPSTGNGGTCYGDSGGPHFLGTGSETKPGIVVSVTSWGEKWCRATDWTARVDTKSVLDFIKGYMNNP
jgi:secreted trypsin-like serine protease